MHLRLGEAQAFVPKLERVIEPRNPWGWLTEARLTYALKLLLVIALALYLSSFALAFLARIFGLLYIVVGAIFLAYLVYPAVRVLRRRLPLGLAIGCVYLVLVLILALCLYLIVPQVANDVSGVVKNAPAFTSQYERFVTSSNPLLIHLPSAVRDELVKLPTFLATWLSTHGAETFSHAVTIVRGAFTVVATFVIIPLLSIYLLIDLDRLRAWVMRLVPRDRWSGALSIINEIDGVVGGFIRGQLIVAGTIGILLTIALLVLHVPYAFLLGALAAVGDLIPYVGAVLTFIPAVGIAAYYNGWVNGAIVAGIFIGLYQLEGHVISPMIMSREVKLTPLVVLLAVLIGAELGGVFGMLVAVPVAGVLRVIFLRLTNQESP